MLKLKQKSKKFSIPTGKKELAKELERLPADGECFKYISRGTVSAICFILAVAEQTVINNLYVSTFRVGKKETLALKLLSDKGRIRMARFLFCGLMESDKYPYFEILKKTCEQEGWVYQTINNHSKVILLDTEVGKFVVETSSNLNENPKIEQFSFEKDDELYDFYKRELFDEAQR